MDGSIQRLAQGWSRTEPGTKQGPAEGRQDSWQEPKRHGLGGEVEKWPFSGPAHL